MTKCAYVGCKNDAIFAWQPFGPDSSPIGTFTALGYHYRGFPVLKVCQECHDCIVNHNALVAMHFVYRGRSYWWNTEANHFEEPPF